MTPLAPERFSVQFTVGQDTFETLRYVQALLGHQIPSGDVAEVFDRALHALKSELEKTRFAATTRPRAGGKRTSDNPRYVPPHVKRTVWERDGGQCGFVSENGARCPERSRLEFDHVVEVARGGEATIDGIRLRCRAHNQYEAERTFGAGFMEHKRDQARRAAEERRAAGATRAETQDVAAEEERAPAERATELDLIHCLKGLGFRAEQAQLAIRHGAGNPDVPIEERLRAAIQFLGSRGRTYALRQAVSNSGASASVAAP